MAGFQVATERLLGRESYISIFQPGQLMRLEQTAIKELLNVVDIRRPIRVDLESSISVWAGAAVPHQVRAVFRPCAQTLVFIYKAAAGFIRLARE
jgi:hypothetical protein